MRQTDRGINAQRFEEQFYQPKPVTSDLEETKETVPQASEIDQETLMKFIVNPELASLLKILAKSL